jgi:hypothetical protein
MNTASRWLGLFLPLLFALGCTKEDPEKVRAVSQKAWKKATQAATQLRKELDTDPEALESVLAPNELQTDRPARPQRKAKSQPGAELPSAMPPDE